MSNVSNATGRILVVSATARFARSLCGTIGDLGHHAEAAAPPAALERLRRSPFDLILVDLAGPSDGVALLREACQADPHLLGILIAGNAHLPAALAALPHTAFDVLRRPVPPALLGAALARALEVRRLRVQVAELRATPALSPLGLALAGLLDEAQITERVLEAAAAQTDADEVTLLRVEAELSGFQVIGARGEGRARIVGERVPPGTGPVAFAAQALQPLILHGEVRDPRITPVRPRPEIRSTLVVPLVAEGQPVGVLTANAIRHDPFTPADLKTLELLAAIAAPALRTAQLVAGLRRRVAELEARLSPGTKTLTDTQI
jgi:CheY-like chemotaxis protein